MPVPLAVVDAATFYRNFLPNLRDDVRVIASVDAGIPTRRVRRRRTNALL
jgi:hypothetical protein